MQLVKGRQSTAIWRALRTKIRPLLGFDELMRGFRGTAMSVPTKKGGSIWSRIKGVILAKNAGLSHPPAKGARDRLSLAAAPKKVRERPAPRPWAGFKMSARRSKWPAIAFVFSRGKQTPPRSIPLPCFSALGPPTPPARKERCDSYFKTFFSYPNCPSPVATTP